MEDRVFIDLERAPLSKLSFVVTEDIYNDREKNLAYKNIKMRLSDIGCRTDVFLEKEQEVIARRGELLSNYLIANNPSVQLLLELYLGSSNMGYSEADYMLFSEMVLSDSKVRKSFFAKLVKIELKNIQERLKDSLSEEEIQQLRKAYRMLKSCLEQNSEGLDIMMRLGNDSEDMDEVYKQYIVEEEMRRLRPQKSAILRSLNSGEAVDYSFLDNACYTLRLIKR